MTRRLILITGLIVLFVGAAVLAGYLLTRGPHGAPTPQGAADGYVSALAHGDRALLADLADPGHDASEEIPVRLAALGGGKLAAVTVTVHDTQSAAVKNATISGTVAGTPYQDTIWLFRHGGRWFVALGPAVNARPKGITSS